MLVVVLKAIFSPIRRNIRSLSHTHLQIEPHRSRCNIATRQYANYIFRFPSSLLCMMIDYTFLIENFCKSSKWTTSL